MNYTHVLAFDPSGSFEEGKGITGWCLMETKTNTLLQSGVISARDFETAPEYWNEHLSLIWNMRNKYATRFLVLAEDYILYADKCESQINSKMETCRLLGILEHCCWLEDIPYRTQTASQVVNRWNNEVLEHRKIIFFEGTRPFLTKNRKPVSRHTLDAIRHATHFSTFKNGKELKNEKPRNTKKNL